MYFKGNSSFYIVHDTDYSAFDGAKGSLMSIEVYKFIGKRMLCERYKHQKELHSSTCKYFQLCQLSSITKNSLFNFKI